MREALAFGFYGQRFSASRRKTSKEVERERVQRVFLEQAVTPNRGRHDLNYSKTPFLIVEIGVFRFSSATMQIPRK